MRPEATRDLNDTLKPMRPGSPLVRALGDLDPRAWPEAAPGCDRGLRFLARVPSVFLPPDSRLPSRP